MRILVAHNVGRSRNGGMSRIMGYIHDEVDRAGHQTDYFCAEDAPQPKLHPSLGRFQYPLAVLERVEQAAAAGVPYDIVNVHEPSAAAVAMLRRKSRKTKVVVTSHGVEERGWELRLRPEATAEERPPARSQFLYPASVLWQARLGLRHCDHVFCLNNEDRDFIMHRYGRKQSEITRIFPAADPIYSEAAASRNYERCGSIVFAASWLIRKGTRVLVDAFAKVADRNPDLVLKVLNPGQPEESVLADFPERLRPRVQVLKARPDDGTSSVLAGSDIFVLPSFFEGTPLTLMEAMWSGLPVITTSVCGMKDVVEDGRNGLLVPARSIDALAQAMEKLVNDAALRRRLGESALADAHQLYNWKKSAEPVVEAYERIAS